MEVFSDSCSVSFSGFCSGFRFRKFFRIMVRLPFPVFVPDSGFESFFGIRFGNLFWFLFQILNVLSTFGSVTLSGFCSAFRYRKLSGFRLGYLFRCLFRIPDSEVFSESGSVTFSSFCSGFRFRKFFSVFDSVSFSS